MQKTFPILRPGLALAAACAIAGCGGGSDTTADPGGPGGPVQVNAFAYVQPIVASGSSETAEPQAVDTLVLSSTETEEPDTRL
jgi:ABC-type oligopeptide transport system substrate-binding subunit